MCCNNTPDSSRLLFLKKNKQFLTKEEYEGGIQCIKNKPDLLVGPMEIKANIRAMAAGMMGVHYSRNKKG